MSSSISPANEPLSPPGSSADTCKIHCHSGTNPTWEVLNIEDTSECKELHRDTAKSSFPGKPKTFQGQIWKLESHKAYILVQTKVLFSSASLECYSSSTTSSAKPGILVVFFLSWLLSLFQAHVNFYLQHCIVCTKFLHFDWVVCGIAPLVCIKPVFTMEALCSSMMRCSEQSSPIHVFYPTINSTVPCHILCLSVRFLLKNCGLLFFLQKPFVS